jgi:hypothetical protein
MKFAIVGSRSFNDYNLLCKILDEYLDPPTEIISGGAMGADSLAARYAREHNIPINVFRPDWDGPEKRGAGLARNTEMVNAAEYVIAFWDGESHGTRDTIAKARKSGTGLRIIHV